MKITGTPKKEAECCRPDGSTGFHSQTSFNEQQGDSLNGKSVSTALIFHRHRSTDHADYLSALERRQTLQDGGRAPILEKERSTSSIHSVDEQSQTLNHLSRSTSRRPWSIIVDVAALKYGKPNGGSSYPKPGFGPSISLPLVLPSTRTTRTSAHHNSHQRWFSGSSSLATDSPCNDSPCNDNPCNKNVSNASRSSKSSPGIDDNHISLDLHEYILGNLKDDHEDQSFIP